MKSSLRPAAPSNTPPSQDATGVVQLPVPEVRIQRAWERAEASLGARQRGFGSRLTLAAALTATVSMAAAGLGLWMTRRAAEPVVDGGQALAATPSSTSTAPAPLKFHITPQAGARVVPLAATEREVMYRLEEGTADFEVEPCRGGQGDQAGHGNGRHGVSCGERPRFVVWAASVRVEVVGTRFRVGLERHDPHSLRAREDGAAGVVEVEVARGTVLVQPKHADARLLEAGERWRVNLGTGEPQVHHRDQTDQAAVPAHADQAQASPEVPRGAAKRRPGAAREAAAARRRSGSSSGARALFERAREAALVGDWSAAMARYRTLLARYPRDARAALAAYELGRIRMDELDDPAGAARYFARARRVAPRAALSDDATARLVRIHAQQGERKRCRALRAAYLQAYPAGRHRAHVSQACP